MGRDRPRQQNRLSSCGFNPRARVGRDPVAFAFVANLDLFQSTRPRGARRVRLFQFFAERTVSIHAPAWGATRKKSSELQGSISFNPRARVGRDTSVIGESLGIKVSIHAPAWGATCPTVPESRIQTVSIHAPAWGATGDQEGDVDALDVSIHAPAWGATALRRKGDQHLVSFNPRARVGRDAAAGPESLLHTSFNPRARVGRDLTVSL